MVRNVKGFTMVELMIVIAIIGILAVTLVPAFKGMQERAKDTGIVNQVEGAAIALEAWKQDTNSLFPLLSVDAAGANRATGVANVNALASYANSNNFTSLKPEKVCQTLDSKVWAIDPSAAWIICTAALGGTKSYGYAPAKNAADRDTYLIWAALNTPSKGTLISTPTVAGVQNNSVVTTPGTAGKSIASVGYYAVHGANK
jgi:prepilin-type N-terminal cleavage/methylation domain-containing protein